MTESGKVREEWFAHREMFRILREVDWAHLSRQCSIGLLWHQEHYWEFLYEGGRIIQPDDYTVVGSKDYGHLAQEPFWLYSKALIDTDTNFDVVDVRTDLWEYPFLIYAAPPFLDAAMQDRLVAYVKAGGRLVFLSPPPHLEVEKSPCTKLMDGLGIERGESQEAQVELTIGDRSHSVQLAERYEAGGREAMLTTADGVVCAVRTHCEEGDVVQVGFSALDEEVLAGVLGLLDAPVHVRGDNHFVQTSLHTSEERAVVIAINRDDKEQTARIQVLGNLGPDREAEELFRRERLEIGPNQTVEVTIPAHEVAVIEIKKVDVERLDLDKDKLIQGYFRL